ncbi:MAG: DRTGG domain-containing protein [Bacteroidales bacterium]
MKVSEIIEPLGLKMISGENNIQKEVTGGYTSDLLSDVIGNAREGNIWITLQTHNNIVAVASLKDLAAIIIVKGLMADEATIEKSKSENIPLLSSADDTFTVSGRLFELLKSR